MRGTETAAGCQSAATFDTSLRGASGLSGSSFAAMSSADSVYALPKSPCVVPCAVFLVPCLGMSQPLRALCDAGG